MATFETITTLLDSSNDELDGNMISFGRLEKNKFKEILNRESNDNLIGEVRFDASAPNPTRRRMSLMERMTIPLVKFRNSHGITNSLKRCRSSLSKITRRVVHGDKTWVGCMVIMSTIDIILNLTNFVMMSKENLNYGLVIGPPSKELWYVLLVFTILSWLLYVPETINTCSVLFSPIRETYIPIPYEMTITLLFKHIPLSTVVYFIGRCRREYTTSLESLCNAFRIVIILVRLIWHAHMEGRKLKKDDKHESKKIFVLICCLLYGISTCFAIKNWRSEPSRSLRRYHLINVSIIMLNEDYIDEHPFPPERLFFSLEISDLIKRQGYNIDKPWLVRSILTIKDRRSLTTDYQCARNSSYEIRPRECNPDISFLRFKFIFLPSSSDFPYGEISYGYAQMLPTISTKNSTNEELLTDPRNATCIQAVVNLRGRWKLYFLDIKRFYRNFTDIDSVWVNASAPFRKSWTHPRPRFNPEIILCLNGTPTSEPHEYEPFGLDHLSMHKSSYFAFD